MPRPYDFHPDAVKVPYHHANADSDEVLFYAGGDFMSRRGLGHRRGLDLVPPRRLRPRPPARQLGALVDQDRTEELAVMLDTFRPLQVAATTSGAADDDYRHSWSD